VAEEKRQAQLQRLQDIQDRVRGDLARIDAVYDADQPSSDSYRRACAEMEEDANVAVQGWRFGSGF
jgi:hypothetical protein